jgi:hypothetical protein
MWIVVLNNAATVLLKQVLFWGMRWPHWTLCPCLSYCFYGSALLTVTYCRLFVFIFHLFRVSCGVDSDRTVMKDWLANLMFMQCFVIERFLFWWNCDENGLEIFISDWMDSFGHKFGRPSNFAVNTLFTFVHSWNFGRWDFKMSYIYINLYINFKLNKR